MATRIRFRLYLLALLVMGGFGLLTARLYQVQIIEGPIHKQRIPGRKFESVRIPGVRGEIKDRNGITLAENLSNYEVRLNLKEILDDYRSHLTEMNKLLKEESKQAGTKYEPEYVPMRNFQFFKGGQPEIKQEVDIVEIVKRAVLPGLGRMKLVEDFNADQMRVHFRSTGGVVPYTYRRDLTFEEFAKFAENNLNLPGVTVTASARRNYVYDSLACHILGYVNMPDILQVTEEKRHEFNHYVPDEYGAQGVEKSMDHLLQGTPGKRVLEKDEKGKFAGIVSETPPGPGADVYLTVDARIQLLTEQALRKVGRGAAVVMDPRNGDILAMGSVPSYNINAFVPSVSEDDWHRYTEDISSPMFNRAINAYSPGSTCKIPIALSGCLDGTDKNAFPCGQGAQYGNKFMKCWCASKGYSHGTIRVSDAIKFSCNGFFYRYGNATGMRNIETMTELLGLNRATGIPLPGESGGRIPTPAYMRQKGINWSDAFTALVAIGQGETECTPLQMASVTSSVCNGGKVFQPRLVKKVLRKNGEVVNEDMPILRHDLTKEGLKPEQIENVKRGMWRVVNDPGGTAGRAASQITVLSGKTGTTQTGNPKQPTNAWFISFAPYDNPEIAVCVFVENGDSGGRAASPIAKHIIEEAISLQRGLEVPLEKLAEAKGNFDRVMEVSFAEGELTKYAATTDASEETAVDVGEFVPTQTAVNAKPKYVAPTIRKKADADGSVSDQNNRSRDRWKNLKLFNVFRKR